MEDKKIFKAEELSDDELENVAGGVMANSNMKVCPHCKKVNIPKSMPMCGACLRKTGDRDALVHEQFKY